MRVVYRGTPGRVRSSFSFGISGCVHGWVLAWVILGGSGPPRERAQSIYDREIRPYEKKIVWYSLQEKLPEIAPADTQAGARAARARVKAPQTMVAGARDDARAAPLIWAPEPEVAAPKEMPLPNVVAVTPKVVRPFLAPAVKAPVLPPVVPLQDAPNVTAADLKPALPLPAVTPKVVRPFLVPSVKAPEPPPVAPLQDAPNVAVVERSGPQVGTPVAALIGEPVTPSGPRRAFAPPPNVRRQRQAMLPLPEGPQAEMVVEPNALPFAAAGPRPQAKPFTPPAAKSRAATAVGLPEAPSVSAVAKHRSGPQVGTPVAAPIGTTPAMPLPAPVLNAEPPAVPRVPGAMGAVSLAIVGLNPARTTEVPKPQASRAAGFSAGPEPRAEGDTGAKKFALVNVPGLVVNNGAKDTQPTMAATFSPTSRENLLAATRVSKGAPKVPVELGGSYAALPDPRFAGRVVYTMAVQMPNVTSYSGSWLVWFAERVPDSGGVARREMRPPEVVRKVDPKYVAAAAADRVEGTVRLFGVIGKDGHVGGIALLRQLDDRLDRTAQEALAKWEFTPAMRDGVAVDVDAIFEIPFHLAPLPKPKPQPQP